MENLKKCLLQSTSWKILRFRPVNTKFHLSIDATVTIQATESVVRKNLEFMCPEITGILV